MTRGARSHFAAAATRTSYALSLVSLCVGCEPVNEVKWRVRFACEQAASDVVLVRTRILAGDCDGEPIYEAELPREGHEAGDVDPPGKLPSGSHGFEATSVNGSGEVISSTCRVVPPSARSTVELLLSSVRCEASEVDGGVSDAGPPECIDMPSGACDTSCDKGFWSDSPEGPCAPVADCPPGTSVEQEATLTHDRLCKPCTNGFSTVLNAVECTPWSECGPEEVELLTGTAIQDRVCGSPDDCAPGTYDTGASPTLPSSMRVCVVCPPGTFSNKINASECTLFTACGAGLEEVTPGSATADVECRDINGCAEADPTLDANPCNTKNLNAVCIDTAAPGTGYTCKCTGGFEPSAGTCVPIDTCPNDPNKTAPGACGCGTPEITRNGFVECTIFTDGFEGGISNWSADGTWRIQSPAETQPPNHPSSNRVAHASGCSYCELTSRVVPTTSAKKLTLSFLRYIDSELDVDSGEYLEVWVHSRGSWTRLRRYRPPNDNDDQWHLETFDLTIYAADDLQISFAAATGLTSEDVEVDNVVLTLTP